MKFLSVNLLAMAALASGMVEAKRHRNDSGCDLVQPSWSSSSSCSSSSSSSSCSSSSDCLPAWMLTSKSSTSQCTLALGSFARQPRSCGAEYLSDVARQIYNPIYQWFSDDAAIVEASLNSFAEENGVGLLITASSGNYTYYVVPGIAADASAVGVPNFTFGFDRTVALNYPTFYQGLLNQDIADDILPTTSQGILSQIVYNGDGQVLLIEIFTAWSNLPIIC